MARGLSLLLALSVPGLVLCSCSKPPEPDGVHAQALGDDPAGAPLSVPPADIGILQNPTEYKPAPGPAGTASRPPVEADRPAAALSAEQAEETARRVVNDFVNALEDGEIDIALGFFDEQQIGPLLDDHDFLFDTYEALDNLREAYETATDADTVEQLSADLRSAALEDLKVDASQPLVLSIRPNPLVLVLGPGQAGDSLRLAQVGTMWKIQLAAPLAEEAVAAARTHHAAVQSRLAALTADISSRTLSEAEKVQDALTAIYAEEAGEQKPAPGDETPESSGP